MPAHARRRDVEERIAASVQTRPNPPRRSASSAVQPGASRRRPACPPVFASYGENRDVSEAHLHPHPRVIALSVGSSSPAAGGTP